MTAFFVATNGGHLSQLLEIESRIMSVSEDRIWVTFDTPQSRSLLIGRETAFIDAIDERDVLGVVRGAFQARKLFAKVKPSAVVSTGSAIALSFLPYAALRGVPAYYVESAARVDQPSLTGKVLSFVPGVRLLRQYASASSGRWRYGGSVFDGFGPAEGADRPIGKMVVTLGTGDHGFRRLIDRLVTIIPSDAQVLWQTGATDLGGLAIKALPIMPAAELDHAIEQADVVIAHAGCGSALSALKAGKCPILVARQPEHGELVDHHQVQLAQWLDQRKLAIARTPESLTWRDIVMAAGRAVQRRADPPPFVLQ